MRFFIASYGSLAEWKTAEKPNPQRWLMLALLSSLSCINQAICYSYAPVNNNEIIFDLWGREMYAVSVPGLCLRVRVRVPVSVRLRVRVHLRCVCICLIYVREKIARASHDRWGSMVCTAFCCCY
jgi:hypothetical protein